MIPSDRNTLLLVQRTLIAEQARITATLADLEALLTPVKRRGRPPGYSPKGPRPAPDAIDTPKPKKTLSPERIKAMIAGRKRAAKARARNLKVMTA